jgi:hypothetical protein
LKKNKIIYTQKSPGDFSVDLRWIFRRFSSIFVDLRSIWVDFGSRQIRDWTREIFTGTWTGMWIGFVTGFVGFCRLRSIFVGFGRFSSASVDFRRLRSIFVGFGRFWVGLRSRAVLGSKRFEDGSQRGGKSRAAVAISKKAPKRAKKA